MCYGRCLHFSTYESGHGGGDRALMVRRIVKKERVER